MANDGRKAQIGIALHWRAWKRNEISYSRCTEYQWFTVFPHSSWTTSRHFLHTTYREQGTCISKDVTLFGWGRALGELYVLDPWKPKLKNSTVFVASINTRKGRLGHVNAKGIVRMSTDDRLPGLNVSQSWTEFCSSCTVGKLTKTNIPKIGLLPH